MSAFTVRRMTGGDLNDFRDIRLEALQLHPDAFGASYEDWCRKPAAFYAGRLSSDIILGGFDAQNQLQGIVGISRSTSPKLQHIATVWGMYVRAEVRSHGLSRVLLASALDAAGTAISVRLSVVATNLAAQSLYRSFGFKVWATDMAALYIDGHYHDEILMRLDRELNS